MKEFTDLIERHLAEKGVTLEDLAKIHAPQHPEVALRKFRDHLSGTCFRDGVANSLCNLLGIDRAEKEAVIKAGREAEDRAFREEVKERQRRNFSPHIWIEVTRNWRPSLLSITGPDIYRKLPVPERLEGLEDDDAIIAACGPFVAAHFTSGKCRVEPHQLRFYVYRKKFDLGYRFTADGGFVEKLEFDYVGPYSDFRVK